MRNILLFLGLFIGVNLSAQSALMDSLLWFNYEYRLEQNLEFADSVESPLGEEDRQNFSSLDWYPLDTNFMVWAQIELTPDAEPFKMPTTTDRKPVYKQYGIAHFQLGDSLFHLPIYQNLGLIKMPQYQDYLFVPFTDQSNGFGSYGGGRYLDLRLPQGDSLLIDFNRAYNPYCAYNGKYSCPIPPRENRLNYFIKAGVRYEPKH